MNLSPLFKNDSMVYITEVKILLHTSSIIKFNLIIPCFHGICKTGSVVYCFKRHEGIHIGANSILLWFGYIIALTCFKNTGTLINICNHKRKLKIREFKWWLYLVDVFPTKKFSLNMFFPNPIQIISKRQFWRFLLQYLITFIISYLCDKQSINPQGIVPVHFLLILSYFSYSFYMNGCFLGSPINKTVFDVWLVNIHFPIILNRPKYVQFFN